MNKTTARKRHRNQPNDILGNTTTGKIATANKPSTKIYFLLLAVLVISCFLGYFYYKSPIRAVALNIEEPRVRFIGKFEMNTILQNGQRILENKGLIKPECMVFGTDQNLYMGLEDGRLMVVQKDKQGRVGEGEVRELVMDAFSEKYGGRHGRPLGLRYYQGSLYVAQSDVGIYKVNLKTNEREVIIDREDVTPHAMFVDDLDISHDGRYIYFSDSCTTHHYSEFMLAITESRCTGRLFRFTTKTKEIKLLRDELCFANGVQLSPDNTKLLIGETLTYRIQIISLDTLETSKVVSFPGFVDNIRASNDGGYWVAVVKERDFMGEVYNKLPFFRQIMVGMIGLENLTQMFRPRKGLVAKLDSMGNVEKFYADPDGLVSSVVTTAIQDNAGNLYTTTLQHDFIAKLNFKYL